MSSSLLMLVWLAAQSPARETEVRWLSFSLTGEKAAPVAGLTREEIAVMENGVAREVTEVQKDERPLTLLVLVDTSQAAATSYRLQVVDPILSLLARMPPETRYAIWTTGDRPTKAVDFTTDRAEAAKALRRVAPQGGNTMLDAIAEATRDLRKQEGERTAVVIVTTLGVEFSSLERQTVVDEAKDRAELFAAVQFEEAAGTFEDRHKYEYVLAELTRATGGLLEAPLSAMGVETALRKIAADLTNRYRLSYATFAGLKQRKLEIKVARPGVKARLRAVAPKS
jgi:VWFA-related protein